MADTGITVRSDVVIPEVISGRVVTSELFKNTPILQSGYVLDIGAEDSGVMYTDGGDSVTFLTREFAAGVEAAGEYVKDMVRTSKTGVDGTKVKISSYTETVTDRTIPIEFDMFAINDAARQGNINQFMAEVVSQAISEELQSKLITTAETTGLIYDASATGEANLTVDNILRAKVKVGEKMAGLGKPGLFIHTNQFADLAVSADYKTLSRQSEMTEFDKASGAVVSIHGVLIFVLDSVTLTAGTPNKYDALMLWPGAMGMLMKDLKTSKIHEYPGTSVRQLDYYLRYVRTLFRNVPRRAVKLRTAATN